MFPLDTSEASYEYFSHLCQDFLPCIILRLFHNLKVNRVDKKKTSQCNTSQFYLRSKFTIFARVLVIQTFKLTQLLFKIFYSIVNQIRWKLRGEFTIDSNIFPTVKVDFFLNLLVAKQEGEGLFISHNVTSNFPRICLGATMFTQQQQESQILGFQNVCLTTAEQSGGLSLRSIGKHRVVAHSP